MRSFFGALLFLLFVSYMAHLYLTHQLNSDVPVPVVINNRRADGGLCECRCCLISGTICEHTIQRTITFRNNFSCDLCTNDLCTINMSDTQQCLWMYTIKAECYQYETRRKSSFIDVRPILQ